MAKTKLEIIRNVMDRDPKVYHKIFSLVAERYSPYGDWSFIRDEDDPKVIDRYLRIARQSNKLKKVM
jgi:hypothetical protein